ncbi:MAG TPA: nucleoside triphosphate pyrophosphohydrolase [Candidatus Kapabacteria bacterium]|nr:nucleoside triphosphate pyrophosphohydrolase [Candidatus Kapabacteria bacterium]HRT67554.1 nucleoside triphosphate pyrophosphohydrolase [Bacteroidota bacterium]
MANNNKVDIPLPQDPNSLNDWFDAFHKLVWALRENCPWDKEQTNESIAQLTIEEAYEVMDAVYKKDDEELSGELGDVLLHIVMHSVIAEQRQAFTLKDVIEKIHSKMVRRHPHVFGEVEVENQSQVLKNWENIKKTEREGSILDGVPIAMPALLRAERIQHKASRVGFDWNEKTDVWAKVGEEFNELKAELKAGDKQKAKEEFGDLLFALVNAARFEDIIPEESLQYANMKFTRRFQYIEKRAKELGKNLNEMTLEEMDALWDEAKEIERKENYEVKD